MSISWEKVSRFSVPEDSVGYLLWQITRLWQQQATVVFDPLGISHVQFTTLAGIGWLSNGCQLVTQTQLAEFCEVDVVMISQAMRKLEAKELVERKPHPFDTRAKVVSLTDSGRQILEKALVIVEELDADFFKHCNHQVLITELKDLYFSIKKNK